MILKVCCHMSKPNYKKSIMVYSGNNVRYLFLKKKTATNTKGTKYQSIQ